MPEPAIFASDPIERGSEVAFPSPNGEMPTDLPKAIEVLERQMITTALQRYQFNQTKAAEELGVSYYQLRRMIKRLEIV